MWRTGESGLPPLGDTYSTEEQAWREGLLDRTIDRADRGFRSIRRGDPNAERILAAVTATVAEMATCALDLQDPYIEDLLRGGFSQVGVDFGRRARRLDPELSIGDLLQACRNAWTACGLQLLLGGTMRLTPAIFAYSMLYPYSDNYLDDARISGREKREFNARFRQRLAGELSTPLSEREEMIWHLVGLIESEYARVEYPDVYDSLLAIHQAQQDSIRQTEQHCAGGLDILTLTITKGGTSVLADAFLARGTLSETEAAFAFHWGVLLQISDDLQDVESDRKRGSMTLFSSAAGREPLDEVTNRTFQFGDRVMAQMAGLPSSDARLNSLLARSSRALLMRSVANLPELYTKPYLAELEKYSPYRFAFLREREREFAKRSRSYGKRLEWLLQALAAEPACEECPSQ